jgi:hypothetical protein
MRYTYMQLVLRRGGSLVRVTGPGLVEQLGADADTLA